MSRPQSAAVQAALADIDLGMTAYAAAKKHGVQQSSISRALKRRANVCPCCGQVVKATTLSLSLCSDKTRSTFA